MFRTIYFLVVLSFSCSVWAEESSFVFETAVNNINKYMTEMHFCTKKKSHLTPNAILVYKKGPRVMMQSEIAVKKSGPNTYTFDLLLDKRIFSEETELSLFIRYFNSENVYHKTEIFNVKMLLDQFKSDYDQAGVKSKQELCKFSEPIKTGKSTKEKFMKI